MITRRELIAAEEADRRLPIGGQPERVLEVRAFEVNAVDYLLKPVEKAPLRETVDRAQERERWRTWT